MNRKERRAQGSGQDNPVAQALYMEGLGLHQAGHLAEAEKLYRQALAIEPKHVGALNLLGAIALRVGQYEVAIELISKVNRLRPDFIDAYSNLGGAYHSLGRYEEAELNYKKVLSMQPDHVDALNNLAGVYKLMGRLDDAVELYRKVISLKPDLPHIYSNLLMTAIYSPSISPEEICDIAERFGRLIADPLYEGIRQDIVADPDRRLRIGYVSPDFREHSVNYFFEPLLRRHDRGSFEVFAYYNHPASDAITERLKKEFDVWRDISQMNDQAACELIRNDKIDILVDMAGHTSDNRLLVFARKPAPVQLTWLGFPATTGMKAMDYRITDPYAEPPGMTENLNVETLWRLPDFFCCYQAHENSPDVIDHPPSEDNGYITFGCFNNFAKVTDDTLRVWERILRQISDARLLLEIPGLKSPKFRRAVVKRMKDLGLPLDRVVLEPRKKENQFVLYNKIDIALDPFPCNGGTTSMDAMWMGVPMITVAGMHFVSRLGVTVLQNAGMPEFVADNIDEYVDLAVGLAADKDRLRTVRCGLRERVAHSPLMDQDAFARNMEDAYREMWRKFCSQSK